MILAAQYDELFFAGGVLAPGSIVTVRNVGTLVAASLWTTPAATAGAANPVTVDASGNLRFFAFPGKYDLFFAGNTQTIYVGPNPDDTVRLRLRPLNALDPPYNADPTGAADSTAAVQAALATGALVEAQGRLKVSSTLEIVGKYGQLLSGPGGKDGLLLVPTVGLAGDPIVLVRNSSHCGVRSLTIEGISGGAAACAIESREDHGDVASNPEGYTTTALIVEDVILGSMRPGAGAGGLVDGVRWTTAGLDENNDVGRLRNVDVGNISGAAYATFHSNSVGHQVIGGSVQAAANVLKLAGGSFLIDATAIAGITSWMFDFGAGTYEHPTLITDIYVEGWELFLRAVAGALELTVHINEGDIKGGVPSVTAVQFDAPNGRLWFDQVTIARGAGIDVVLEATHAGSIVGFHGGESGFGEMRYEGDLILSGLAHSIGGPVLLTPTDVTARRFVSGNVGGQVINDDLGEAAGPFVFPTPFDHGSGGGVSATTDGHFVSFRPERRHLCNGALIRVGAAAGNVEVQLYDDALNEIATSGPVACPAAGYRFVPFAAAAMCEAGRAYIVGFAASSGAATFGYLAVQDIFAALESWAFSGHAYPLPAVFGAPADTAGNYFTIKPAYVP